MGGRTWIRRKSNGVFGDWVTDGGFSVWDRSETYVLGLLRWSMLPGL